MADARTWPEAVLAILASAGTPLPTPEIAARAGFAGESRQRVLSMCGNVLRRLRSAGLAEAAGTIPGGYQHGRVILWQITDAGRAEPARKDAARTRRHRSRDERPCDRCGQIVTRQEGLRMRRVCDSCRVIPHRGAPSVVPCRDCGELTERPPRKHAARRCDACAAAARKPTGGTRASIANLAGGNDSRQREAGERNAALARALLNAPGATGPQRRAAELRIAHPHASWSELAAIGGFASRHVIAGHWHRLLEAAACSDVRDEAILSG